MTTLDRPKWKRYPLIEAVVITSIFIVTGAFVLAALGGIAGAHLAPFWYPDAAKFTTGGISSIPTETLNAYNQLPNVFAVWGAFIGGFFGAVFAYAPRRPTPRTTG